MRHTTLDAYWRYNGSPWLVGHFRHGTGVSPQPIGLYMIAYIVSVVGFGIGMFGIGTAVATTSKHRNDNERVKHKAVSWTALLYQ